jgi:uncharacterized membrane protein YGL010W
MRQIEQLLDTYGESHQNPTNKFIHWFCVPAIVFSGFGMLYAIPFPIDRSIFLNWAAVGLFMAMIYYLRLSLGLATGLFFVCAAILWGNNALFNWVERNNGQMVKACFIIFFIAWVGQFIGHKIEGKKPSFIDDVQYLLVGPAWLLHFIYKKLGVKY